MWEGEIMAVCAVTRHAERRIRQRVGIPKKAARRAAAKAITQGIGRVEISGGLRHYLNHIYSRGNGEANNIRLYGNNIYLFDGSNTLITVLIVPPQHTKQAAKLMRKRSKL